MKIQELKGKERQGEFTQTIAITFDDGSQYIISDKSLQEAIEYQYNEVCTPFVRTAPRPPHTQQETFLQ